MGNDVCRTIEQLLNADNAQQKPQGFRLNAAARIIDVRKRWRSGDAAKSKPSSCRNSRCEASEFATGA